MSNPTQNTTPAPAIIGGGWSIATRYLPATNSRGSRVKAWRTDTDGNGKTESVVVPFDYGARDAHDTAAIAWFARHGKTLGVVKLHKGNLDRRGNLYTVCFE